ncbi:MAG: hypothetical protein E5V86_13410 [Mesorhizobium sp.]|nr:MAG: hypothetical protein E5V86_13410 [Mesorhizobium sp.]
MVEPRRQAPGGSGARAVIVWSFVLTQFRTENRYALFLELLRLNARPLPAAASGCYRPGHFRPWRLPRRLP